MFGRVFAQLLELGLGSVVVRCMVAWRSDMVGDQLQGFRVFRSASRSWGLLERWLALR